MRGALMKGLWAASTLFAFACAGTDSDKVMRFLRAAEEFSKTWEEHRLTQDMSSIMGGAISSFAGGDSSGLGSAAASAIGGGDSSGLAGAAANALGSSIPGGSSTVNTATNAATAASNIGGADPSLLLNMAGSFFDTTDSTAPSPTPSAYANLPPVSAPLTSDCGSPMTISVASLSEYRLFVDGTQVGYSNGVQYQTFSTTYGSSGKITIAIEATRDRDLPNFDQVDGISINVTVCNNLFTTDLNWLCTDTRPWTNNWRTGEYTTTSFSQARLVRDDQLLYDGTKSFYIWPKQCSATPASLTPERAYCRATIKPSTCTATPCYKEQTLTAMTDSCLSGCSTATANMDDCAAIAYRLANPCTSCPATYLAMYKNYCKNKGCTPDQCQSKADPVTAPNSTCLAPCTQGMSQITGACKQQAFQFQSGCSATCGPDALAYARDICINEYGCSPAECQVFNTTTAATGEATKPKPKYTPPPTPDLTCFFPCLSGMNKYDAYCDKIQYALSSGCAKNCPSTTLNWAHESCLSYVDDVTGAVCTPSQCA